MSTPSTTPPLGTQGDRPLEGIIFDVDGTLADTEELHRQAFNASFRAFGLAWEWTPPRYQALLAISGGRERMAHYAAAVALGGAPVTLTPQLIAEIHRDKTERYGQLLRAGSLALRPGAARLIQEARAAGVRLAIATSSARTNLETLLNLNLAPDWPQWFAAIETCESVPAKKPAPAVYQAALANAGLSATHCVAIEDTTNGLQAALAAGLRTVITTHRYTRCEAFPGASLVVDGLGEPTQPPRLQAGDLYGQTCVNLALLRCLVR